MLTPSAGRRVVRARACPLYNASAKRESERDVRGMYNGRGTRSSSRSDASMVWPLWGSRERGFVRLCLPIYEGMREKKKRGYKYIGMRGIWESCSC